MSKKPMPSMDELVNLKAKRDDTQAPTKHSTNNTQTPHERSTDATLKRYDVRFNPDDWEWLKQHFQAMGLTVSAGLRMIVKEYMGKEKL